MLQALLKSLGVYENSARLRGELQQLVDAQRDGLRLKTSAVASVVVWGIVAAVLFSLTAVIALIAIYISLRENYGPQVAIWTVLGGVAVVALATGFVTWRQASAIPALPAINVPELYREPILDAQPTGEEAVRGNPAQASSFGSTSFAGKASLDNSLKDWMVKTATRSASSIQADDIPVGTLLKSVEPHVSAMATSAIDDVAEQLKNSNKGKMALILGSAVLAGLLISRTSK